MPVDWEAVALNVIVVALLVLPVLDILCTVFMFRIMTRLGRETGRVNLVLRDRLIASVIQTTTVTIVGLLSLDRLLGNVVVLRAQDTSLILAFGLVILAVPPIYWFITIYRAHPAER